MCAPYNVNTKIQKDVGLGGGGGGQKNEQPKLNTMKCDIFVSVNTITSTDSHNNTIHIIEYTSETILVLQCIQ